ncbi:hypothetical protein Cob_v006768 [Colletotrichum orbiculare MAFF 240422]|uniref:Uncharacterized protein n=1 Tax=Colletotrichum orbiculare (strain 104-T / ATCC 96160 / CBS 514.97 / LARS 414 / MAFF 240422) TaxID=1213857 RepID=A0A484FTM1_COLOR|nr:hypothetical protein Cob_v006768 [Colletotrichum orbiculare MAFF 240422]
MGVREKRRDDGGLLASHFAFDVTAVDNLLVFGFFSPSTITTLLLYQILKWRRTFISGRTGLNSKSNLYL